MPKGKQTCKILKEIRKQIAAENDIELVVSECTYQGDCAGTCPKCEAEVRYLEQELEKRQRLGKAVMISGLAVSTMLGAASCRNTSKTPLQGDVPRIADSLEYADSIAREEYIRAQDPVIFQGEPAIEPDDVAPTELNNPEEAMEDSEHLMGLIIPGDNIEITDCYYIVDQMPEFPGGDEKLQEYLQNSIVYPQEAKDAGAKGRVFVNFVIEVDGSVSNVKVLRGIGYGCDEAAVKAVESMPKWKPGYQKGVAVRVQSNLPISFK